jgi:hypothetical protein
LNELMDKLAKWVENKPYSLLKGTIYLIRYGDPVYRPESDRLYRNDHPEKHVHKNGNNRANNTPFNERRLK